MLISASIFTLVLSAVNVISVGTEVNVQFAPSHCVELIQSPLIVMVGALYDGYPVKLYLSLSQVFVDLSAA